MTANSVTPGEKWYRKDTDEVLTFLNTSVEGLSENEAASRLNKYGKNEIEKEEKTPAWLLLLGQFKSLLIIILIIAALVSAAIGQMVEAVAIIIIVILAGVLGFFQEYQAGKSLEALQKMAAPNTTVKRNGEKKIIAARDVVPGDIVILNTGDQVPADCRLLEEQNLKVNESSLTGESLPVNKRSGKIDSEETALGDRKNMIYMGTSLSFGRCTAIVVETGMNTEFGKIADLLRTSENRQTPLQKNLDELGKKIGIFAIVLAAVLSLLGILRGYQIIEMFVWGVALAVAVIPEALPAVVTISIALGVRRMVKRKALVRNLPAVETLGSTNIICSDKTGTLTQDEMTIRKIFNSMKTYEVFGSGYAPSGKFVLGNKRIEPDNYPDLKKMLECGVLCNDTSLLNEDDNWSIIGDPTEGAIVVAAEKGGIKVDDLKEKYPRVYEIPFSSETKRMTTVHQYDGKKLSCVKGAPEVILSSCDYYLEDGEEKELTDEIRRKILDEEDNLGEEALRVLAFAYKNLATEEITNELVEQGLVFAGLCGMIDPPRPEAREAIKKCEMAGIKPLMITGDHKVTAVAVARELGILKEGGAITGVELEKMSDEEIDEVTENTEVYARISPAHKLKIVRSLMKKGNIVTMTGDGVNDAPSLKNADIGVAMGIKGTDVSREASDMILTDDNFASIVSAIEEGRSIFENIKKYLIYLLSGNLGTVFAMIIALMSGLPLPLMAVQVLFINFLMDGLIAIALGVEPSEKGIMQRKPRDVNQGILNTSTLVYTIGAGVWIGVITIAIFIFALQQGMGEEKAVTIFFATLIFARLFNGLNCRSITEQAINMNILKNKALLFSSIFSILLTVAVIYIPVLNGPFHTVPLDFINWLLVIGYALTVLIFVEIGKVIQKKHFPMLVDQM